MTEWDILFLNFAKEISLKSKDPSTKVGAVIARPDNSFCSIGYNGFPMAIKDTEERLNNRELKYKIIIHAEMNAAAFAREEIRGYTLYTYPFMPCAPCASYFIQKGIKRVVSPKSDNPRWQEDFKLTRILFNEAGIILEEV